MQGQKALGFQQNILICVPKFNECLLSGSLSYVYKKKLTGLQLMAKGMFGDLK